MISNDLLILLIMFSTMNGTGNRLKLPEGSITPDRKLRESKMITLNVQFLLWKSLMVLLVFGSTHSNTTQVLVTGKIKK